MNVTIFVHGLHMIYFSTSSVCRQVVHSNVTRLFGVVSFTFPYYMVMELPANGDLKSFLCACRKPSHSIALTSRDILLPMIKDAASGLAYLHSMSMVHRFVTWHTCELQYTLENGTQYASCHGQNRAISLQPSDRHKNI
jgi:serine/threonine protein kinase